MITVENVSMKFNLSREKVDNLKEHFIKMVKGQLLYDEFWALREVSFTVEKGEIFGVMGLNGSGKSTLLKIVSGIFQPTIGKVTVGGSIAPLIELGAGFDMELTARENVFLNGAVLGYTKKFMESKVDEIIDFAELWDFRDVPVKNFSSGMYGRLGFSVATLVKPDILIADEILSVGDFKFKEKCEKRIQNLVSGGTTVLLVSHEIELMKRLCSKGLLLEKGRVKCVGPILAVCGQYQALA